MMNKTLALVALLTLPIAVYGKTVGTTSIGFSQILINKAPFSRCN